MKNRGIHIAILFLLPVILCAQALPIRGKMQRLFLDTLSSRLGTSIVVTDTARFGKTVFMDTVSASDTLRIKRHAIIDSSLTIRTLNSAGLNILDPTQNLLNIQSINAEKTVRAKGAYNTGVGHAAEIGVSSGAGRLLSYDRTALSYMPVQVIGSTIAMRIGSIPKLSIDASGNTTLAGDLAVNGGDITSTATTFNLLNSTVTTANAFGASTALTLGATTGNTLIRNDLTLGSTAKSPTKSLYAGAVYSIQSGGNNFFFSRTGYDTVLIGTETARWIIYNLSRSRYDLTCDYSTGNFSLIDLAVNGGDLTSTATTFNLLNSTVTTANAFGAADVNIGGSSKTVTTGGSFKIRTGATIDSIKVVSDTLRIYVGGVEFKAVP